MTNLSTSFVKRMQADFCTREVTASEDTRLPRDKDYYLFCCLCNRGYREEETPPHSYSVHRWLLFFCDVFLSILLYTSLSHG